MINIPIAYLNLSIKEKKCFTELTFTVFENYTSKPSRCLNLLPGGGGGGGGED